MKKFRKLSLFMFVCMLIAIANPIGASAEWKSDNKDGGIQKEVHIILVGN